MNEHMKSSVGVTIIRNGTLVDGTGAPAVRDGAVVIENDRITYAGTAAEAPQVSENARVIDAGGGTILPGLVEAHF
ncbi:MAG: amidohydrolase family protein, partial [Phycisphaerae bacterium]